MPHVIVKMYPGRSTELKQALADALTQAVRTTLNSDDAAISVAIEDVPAERWEEDVWKPDILARSETLFKKPGGYDPSK